MAPCREPFTHERTATRDPRKRLDRDRGSSPRNRAKRSGNTVSGKRCQSRRRWALPTLAARAVTRRPRSIVMLAARTGRGVVRRSASSSLRTRGDACDLDLSWYSRREPGDVSRAPRVVVPLHAPVMANNGEVRPMSHRRLANSGEDDDDRAASPGSPTLLSYTVQSDIGVYQRQTVPAILASESIDPLPLAVLARF